MPYFNAHSRVLLKRAKTFRNINTKMKHNHKTLYLVDGSSYLHRAFHAIRNLSNSKGFPTNAVFGFTNMLLKLIDEKSPQYLAIAFDARGPNFRHEIYKEYKANRPPMPEDMFLQVPYIKDVISGMNITALEKEGYEADDIIGTISNMAENKGLDVVIVSGDKDFRQLITEKTSMWDPMSERLIDQESIKRDYGIEPGQMIEVMALSGDSSDNIPGIPGVGEKTALALIKQFHSTEELIENTYKITKLALKEKVEQSREQALLSKKLVCINKNVPIDIKVEDLRFSQPDKERLAKTFRELEFKSLIDRFSEHAELGEKDYRLITNKADLCSLAQAIKDKGIFCLDTETTSKNPMYAELVGISICIEPGIAYYLPLGHSYIGAGLQMNMKEALNELKEAFTREDIKKIGQNIKYDAEVLAGYGIRLKGMYFDTMIASYILDPTLHQHNLDYLAQHYLGYKMLSYGEVVTGRDKNFAYVDIERAREYSCEDAEITFKLYSILEPKLKDIGNFELFQDLEMALIPVIMDMEMTGIKIDSDFFREISKRYATELKSIELRIFELAGEEFNINSTQQLGYILFEKLKLPRRKKTKKKLGYSTDVEVLKELAGVHEVPSLLLRFRLIGKLKSTYLDALVGMVNPATGRIHTSYNQTVTATGRLSSSNPNLQNIPIRTEEGRAIRRGFVPEKGSLLISADYSQIELRIFAHYADDPVLIQAFKNDEDIHARTAAEVFNVAPGMISPEMRRMAKAINFGIIYGMGPVKLARELGIGRKTAESYLENYYRRYRGVKEFKDRIISYAREQGFVTTLLKRRRYLPNINSENGHMKSEAERAAINTPIQGTAADLIKMAMITIAGGIKKQGLKAKILLQVHDELVFGVPENELEEAAGLIKREMEDVHPLKVPLKVDIKWGSNWEEAH